MSKLADARAELGLALDTWDADRRTTPFRHASEASFLLWQANRAGKRDPGLSDAVNLAYAVTMEMAVPEFMARAFKHAGTLQNADAIDAQATVLAALNAGRAWAWGDPADAARLMADVKTLLWTFVPDDRGRTGAPFTAEQESQFRANLLTPLPSDLLDGLRSLHGPSQRTAVEDHLVLLETPKTLWQAQDNMSFMEDSDRRPPVRIAMAIGTTMAMSRLARNAADAISETNLPARAWAGLVRVSPVGFPESDALVQALRTVARGGRLAPPPEIGRQTVS